ncbi:hypothetical protein CORC01_13779 [Colletotrichum orchidophilum]|uniref:F-box domain-containing protein n=1 Tax=Colletotrichum orchidophilum TaxID=1209926 RepID=A0A1G4AP29_9PEZI|nr:uncharacterized protein CORC01_13779 [Colletotrichum orchidophilum]OHE90924.1 hypothetical protein CORC01_13779 [Colletotrichum orchidophilum]
MESDNYITSAQRKCLLLSLPLELRCKIYIKVFEGSEFIYVSFYSYNHNPVRPEGFNATPEHSILLTCRQIYEEARSMYWAESLVDSGGQSIDVMSRLLDPFAKAHVGHLRGVLGDVRRDPRPDRFLVEFPRLKTIRLSNAFVTHFTHEKFVSITSNEESIIAHIQRRMIRLGLDKFSGDEKSRHGVQFLVGAVFIGCRTTSNGSLVIPYPKHKHCFYNITTGKLFTIDFDHRDGMFDKHEDNLDASNFEHVLSGRYLRGTI